MSTQHDELMSLCEEVRKVDDALGQRSDHEGNEEGPTFICWGAGKKRFHLICREQISNHLKAAQLWIKLKDLNAARTAQERKETT